MCVFIYASLSACMRVCVYEGFYMQICMKLFFVSSWIFLLFFFFFCFVSFFFFFFFFVIQSPIVLCALLCVGIYACAQWVRFFAFFLFFNSERLHPDHKRFHRFYMRKRHFPRLLIPEAVFTIWKKKNIKTLTWYYTCPRKKRIYKEITKNKQNKSKARKIEVTKSSICFCFTYSFYEHVFLHITYIYRIVTHRCCVLEA